jgi:U3 small nucleolar RNA-associated protein 25
LKASSKHGLLCLLPNAYVSSEKKKDSDFLSSIEILVVDQGDALLMQNWDHVPYILSQMNQFPKEAHGCDFSRVRNWYLEGNAKYLRQTIVYSAFLTPDLNSLFTNQMQNVAGKMKYQTISNGSMLTTGLPIKQTFSRFAISNIQREPDARFNFFVATIIPWILRSPRPPGGGLGIVVFIPSYFDFVRVRNFFSISNTTANISYGAISENSSPAEPEVRRARSHFLSGKHSVMLYSGRAHHFFRYMVKGVKNVVMYQLPDNPLFYQEAMVGWIGASVTAGRISAEESRVRVLFSKFDALRLERVVGTERVGAMLSKGDTFDFV